jgi:hypothetical protein
MLLAVIILGTLGFVWGLGMAVRDGRGRTKEAGVLGSVQDVEMTSAAPSDDQCQVRVTYSYEVNGEPYQGSTTRSLDRYKAEQVLAEYQAGTVYVLYDPELPTETWLEPKTGNIIVPMLVAALGSAAAGVAMIFYTAG